MGSKITYQFHWCLLVSTGTSRLRNLLLTLCMYIHDYYLSDLEMKIWIYWSESNLWIYICIVLIKKLIIYWLEQSFTGLGPETGAHREDRTKFYWSWAGDRCSSWGLNKVLLVLGRRNKVLLVLGRCSSWGLIFILFS